MATNAARIITDIRFASSAIILNYSVTPYDYCEHGIVNQQVATHRDIPANRESRSIVKYSQVPKIRDSYACIRRFSKKKIQRLSLPLYRNLTVSSEGGRGIDSDLYKRLPAPTPPTSPCPVLFVEISDPAVFGILFMSESSKQCFEA